MRERARAAVFWQQRRVRVHASELRDGEHRVVEDQAEPGREQEVGLERSGPQLREALEQIESWVPYGLGASFRDVPSWTVQNMLLTAYLLTLAALRREESRGVHYRTDFPERDDARWRRRLSLSREDVAAPPEAVL